MTPDERALHRSARGAGALYLSLAVIAPFSMIYVPSQMLVAVDGVASTARVLAHEGLFRAGMIVDAGVLVIEIVLTVLLHRLFVPVDRTLATMATFARLAMTIVQGVNVGVLLVTLRLAETAQPALVLAALLAHADVVLVWQVFFGLHCMLLGVLIGRSERFPKVLGLLMLAAAAGYLSDSFGRFASPRYGDHFGWLVAPPALVGELAFTFWLLVKGTLPRRRRRAAGRTTPLRVGGTA
jgi:Domain of unknown function (DUF4386)